MQELMHPPHLAQDLSIDLFQRAPEKLKIMPQKKEKLSSQPLKRCVIPLNGFI